MAAASTWRSSASGSVGEVIGARWSEIDFAAKTWTVPRERMKAAAREHRIVLSDAAIAVLDLVIDRKHEFVFTRAGCRLLSGGLMVKLLKRMNCGDVTTHGFRATFKIWAAAHTAYPRELIEIALSPAEGDALELTYQRGDMIEKRRRLMDDWARHCATPARGPAMS